MTVDGGKALSSRGQQDWYGTKYMNRKFEHDAVRSNVNYLLKKQKQSVPPAKVSGKRALEDWVNSMQSNSSWATKADDAHSKYMSEYTNQIEEVQHLKNASNMHQPGLLNNPAVARPRVNNN